MTTPPNWSDDDIYVTSAMALFDVKDRANVTPEQREQAKKVALRTWANGVLNALVEYAQPGEPRCGRTRDGKPCVLRADHVTDIHVFDANRPPN